MLLVAQGQPPKGTWLLGEVPAESGWRWDFCFRLKVWVSPKSDVGLYLTSFVGVLAC